MAGVLQKQLPKLWSPRPEGEPKVRSYPGGHRVGLNGDNPDAAVRQVQVGFDFGSSSVKCVYRLSADEVFPIEFTASKVNPWVLPGRVARSKQGEYRLAALRGDDVIRNIKIPLLSDDADEDSIRHAVAFLALAMRAARAFFYYRYGARFDGNLFFWVYNVGIPAASSEESGIKRRYDRILNAAHAASCSDSPIDDQLVSAALDDRLDANELPVEINVVPEVVAQVHELFSAGTWDASQNLVAVMDVGAGTVDTALFVVNLEKGKKAKSVAVIGLAVKELGVARFHAERVQRIRHDLEECPDAIAHYLDDMSALADIANSLPDAWSGYIEGYMPSEEAVSAKVDSAFGGRVSSMVFEVANYARSHGYCEYGNWKELPLVLCGGGYNEQAFRYARTILARKGSAICMFERMQQVPANVRNSGIAEAHYRFLSLAFGLSHDVGSYPKYVPPGQVSPQSVVRRVEAPQMIGSEHV